MTVSWEVRQDPRDPNAWDVYQGSAKIAHLPWCNKANAEYMARAFNCHEELVATLWHLFLHGYTSMADHDLVTAALAKATPERLAAEGTK